jgi:hypothetical protein
VLCCLEYNIREMWNVIAGYKKINSNGKMNNIKKKLFKPIRKGLPKRVKCYTLKAGLHCKLSRRYSFSSPNNIIINIYARQYYKNNRTVFFSLAVFVFDSVAASFDNC